MKRSYRAALIALVLIFTLACGALAAPYRAKAKNNTKVYSESGRSIGTLKQGAVVTVLKTSKGKALVNYQGSNGVVKANALTKTNADVVTGKVVTDQTARVYKSASTSSKSVKIARNVTLDVIGTKGGFTIVVRNGIVGYIPTTSVRIAAEAPETTKEPSTVGSDGYTEVTPTAVVSRTNIKLYKKANMTGSYVILSKGFGMTVTGVKNSKYARVTSGGVVRYTLISGLKTESVKEASSAVFNSGESNEKIIYRFLTEICGYNSAAACGVAANIRYESDFRPGDIGDGGTSYGIAQWHADRKSSLISWCDSNGYDYTTLKGQCYYLKHDLEDNYTKVHNYLKGVANTPKGAYDAGYYYCYYFECPANRSSKSVTRGNYAKNIEWPKLAQ